MRNFDCALEIDWETFCLFVNSALVLGEPRRFRPKIATKEGPTRRPRSTFHVGHFPLISDREIRRLYAGSDKE